MYQEHWQQAGEDCEISKLKYSGYKLDSLGWQSIRKINLCWQIDAYLCIAVAGGESTLHLGGVVTLAGFTCLMKTAQTLIL